MWSLFLSLQTLRRLPSEGTRQETSTGRWSSVSRSPRTWPNVCRLTLLTQRPTTPPPLKVSETQLKVMTNRLLLCLSVCLLYRVSAGSHAFSCCFIRLQRPTGQLRPRGEEPPQPGASVPERHRRTDSPLAKRPHLRAAPHLHRRYI